MNILYMDDSIIVCEKPQRVLSTNEPGGLPDLIRTELGDPRMDIRTVHRLDRVVGGLMVLARGNTSASDLSRQVRENTFKKQYLAVVHGHPPASGTFVDLLYRDKARKMTMITDHLEKGVQETSLDYRLLGSNGDMSRVEITLHTGRTHQIRVQFASRGFPLVGERKYSQLDDDCEIALWSSYIAFFHPETNEWMEFSMDLPSVFPWTDV